LAQWGLLRRGKKHEFDTNVYVTSAVGPTLRHLLLTPTTKFSLCGTHTSTAPSHL